jgi:ABC-2 type transport system permease protein
MISYLRVEIVRMFRNTRFVIFTIALPVAFYLLFAGTSKGTETVSGDSMSVKIYLMVSMAAYGAVGAALTTTGQRLAIERKSGWLKQLQVTPLSAWSVIAAKTISAMVLSLPALLAVSAAGYLFEGVRLDAGEWAVMVALMVVATLPFAALGTLIGSMFSADASQPVTLICYFALSIVGGLWMPTSSLPKALRTVSDWLPSNRFAEIGRSIVAGHTPSAAAFLILAAWSLGLGALAVNAYRRTTVAVS